MKKTLFAVYEAKHCRIVMPTTTQPEPSIIFHMVPAEGRFNKLLAKLDPAITLARLTKEMLLVHTDKATLTYPCDFDWVPENRRISNWVEVMEARVKLRKEMKKLEEIKLNSDLSSNGHVDQQYVKHGVAGVDNNTLGNISLSGTDGGSTGYAPDLTERVNSDRCILRNDVPLVAREADGCSRDITDHGSRLGQTFDDTKVCTDSATSGNYSSDCSCSSGE